MNRNARRTLRTIFGRPTSAKLRWADVDALLLLLAVEKREKREGSGSRVRFSRHGRVLGIHRPHPRPELKKYQVEAVREFLQLIGEAPE